MAAIDRFARWLTFAAGIYLAAHVLPYLITEALSR